MRVRAACASESNARIRSAGSEAAGSSAVASKALLDARELRLEADDRLAEEANGLVEAHHVGPDPRGRTEVHDLHRDAPADPIEPADALLHRHRVPGQVEEHQAGAELEVAAFASALGRNQQARAVGATEACDLEVAPRRGEVFVEDAGRELARGG